MHIPLSAICSKCGPPGICVMPRSRAVLQDRWLLCKRRGSVTDSNLLIECLANRIVQSTAIQIIESWPHMTNGYSPAKNFMHSNSSRKENHVVPAADQDGGIWERRTQSIYIGFPWNLQQSTLRQSDS